MGNDYFQFKQFTVRHDLCAMKVGTDGVLLGAVAEGGDNILDIGTGTGLVAIMMAQRFPDAMVTGIDIDRAAVAQATANTELSPFADRIKTLQADFATFTTEERYNSIVCNPPFFDESLECPDQQRNMARHTSSLPFPTLIGKAAQLLTDNGVMTLIIPADRLQRIESESAYASLFITKRLFIRTVECKQPKRVILFLTKRQPVEPITQTECLMENGARSKWYSTVCRDFYL